MSQVCSNTVFTGNVNVFYFEKRLLPLICQKLNFTSKYFKTIIQIVVPLNEFFFFFRMAKIWRVWHIVYSNFNSYFWVYFLSNFIIKSAQQSLFVFSIPLLTIYVSLYIKNLFLPLGGYTMIFVEITCCLLPNVKKTSPN